MMNMTTSNTSFGGFAFMAELHGFFFFASLVGFILLATWAVRTLKKEQMRTLIVWLLVVGIAGSLLTAPYSPTAFWHKGKMGGEHMMKNMGNMQQMMDMMMEHDKGTGGESHEEHQEMQEIMQQMGPWHDQQGNVRGMMN